MSEHSHADTVGGAIQSGDLPTLGVGNQYVRSVAFKVLNAPDVYSHLPTRPHIGLVLDVNARQLVGNQLDFEVTLTMRAQGLSDVPNTTATPPQTLYELEIAYAGLFALNNPPGEQLESLLLVDAPRMLFPGARNILLNLVREAGFPVVNIQPVDFVALWHARRAQS